MTLHRTFLHGLLLLVLAASTSLFAQKREKPYIIIKTPKGDTRKIECREIIPAPNGQLSVVTDAARATYQRNNYVVAVVPLPQEVEHLEELLDDESYNDLIRSAPAIFEKYKFLGYADTVARYHCEALLAQNKKDEAEKVLAVAAKYPRKDEFNITRINLQLLLHDKKTAEAEKQLDSLMQEEDDETAAFVFNMRGRLNELAGKKKEAVLQYLKTFLTFGDKRKYRRFRKEAKANALRLMKELGDPQAQILEQLK